ncbi:ADP-ribosylglycohydrolase family protein [Actinomadura harenae]|uniref:ADP-ribosylglycohydrolase family protein n=1 Tax=Actinomadura harenae TaxID=2483351 RepID=A0A3M2M0A1_9ACTN|nr:ADP-ribosylglycohydrolase family protein [Actinomadura harenae]RMI41805.1 ADP-ribosylglycohydrolase family protein [Actinomadura harenae]
MSHDRIDRARGSLAGLALGDALGSQFFVPSNRSHLDARSLPPGPWQWTDDTEMACSVYLVLAVHRGIDQDVLAASFAERHDFDRGYGPSTNRMLRLVREGGDWRELAAGLFDGGGSWGNGAAMRVAPLGAFLADDLSEAARQAALSATVTHTHPEAVAGAVAVAVAAGLAASGAQRPGTFIDRILEHVPEGKVRDGLVEARHLLTLSDAGTVAQILGNGRAVAAHDTVPFAIWAAARNLDDFERAFWTTASAGGDVDTTCAIVGGIVASGLGSEGLPNGWLEAVEPLPSWASPG